MEKTCLSLGDMGNDASCVASRFFAGTLRDCWHSGIHRYFGWSRISSPEQSFFSFGGSDDLAGTHRGTRAQPCGAVACRLLSILGAVSLGFFTEAFYFESPVFIAALGPKVFCR